VLPATGSALDRTLRPVPNYGPSAVCGFKVAGNVEANEHVQRRALAHVGEKDFEVRLPRRGDPDTARTEIAKSRNRAEAGLLQKVLISRQR